MNGAEERNVIPLPVSDLQQQPSAQSPDPAHIGNIDKIRDILFGAQMRDYDRRFVRLEEKLIKEAAEAREDARRRIDALENYIKQEITALTERIRAEQQQRSQSTEEITRELRDTARNLSNKLAQMDEQTGSTYHELRQQILDQSKILSDDVHHKYEEVTAALSRESSELRNDKADRVALSNLFTELAMRLNGEFKLPGEE